ncbi:MAG: hypothetical protein EPO35_00985 [Acidobacteria bacterium]|nr:MAG: hypothetical protein EPO35_00985 [Acidobacteriota bacterium]
MTIRPLRLIPAVVALAAAALFTFRPTYDPDLFWHLAQGRHDVQVGLVRANIFSATNASYPQRYTSWGFEVVQATVEGSYGLLGVQILQWVFLAAALLMLYAAARTKGSRVAAFTVLLLALFVIEPRAMPRPYLVSFVGFALCAWWASLVPRPTSIVPVLVIGLWSNFHSESVFGLALIVLGTLHGPPWSSKVKLWLVCALATLATPYGVGLWRYLYENTAVPSVLRIAELEPATVAAYPAFFAFLAVLAVALASMPRRLTVSEALVAVFFAALGVRYIRFMPMVAFATAPMLADRIQAWIERGWDRRAVLVTAAAIMAVTAPASPGRMVAAWRTGQAALAPKEYFSEGAIEFIRANQLSTPMFNSMNLGGYLDWKLGGKTFIDSRLQAAPREWFVALTEAAHDEAKWTTLVKDVNWAVVSLARPTDISGVGKFNAPAWISVFRDPAVEIFVRRGATLR